MGQEFRRDLKDFTPDYPYYGRTANVKPPARVVFP